MIGNVCRCRRLGWNWRQSLRAGPRSAPLRSVGPAFWVGLGRGGWQAFGMSMDHELRKHYVLLLGIGSPWEVKTVELKLSERKVEIELGWNWKTAPGRARSPFQFRSSGLTQIWCNSVKAVTPNSRRPSRLLDPRGGRRRTARGDKLASRIEDFGGRDHRQFITAGIQHHRASDLLRTGVSAVRIEAVKHENERVILRAVFAAPNAVTWSA